MTYIEKGKQIPDDDRYEQIFYYEPSTRNTGIAYKTIELKQKSVINEVDLDIVKFLYNFSMARLDQICKAIQVGDAALVRNRIEKLISQRILNKFMISDNRERFTDKAEVIYCMDFGGLPLIEHFTNDQDVHSWSIDKVVFPATKVNRKLMLVDLYLRIRSNKRLSYFVPEPLYFLGRNRCHPAVVFGLSEKEKERHFVMEIFREEEILYTTAKINNKINRITTILENDAWSKNFRGEKAPTLMLFCDTELCALEVSKIFLAAKYDDFRIMTLTSFKGNLANAFYKVEQTESNLELKPINISAFLEPPVV